MAPPLLRRAHRDAHILLAGSSAIDPGKNYSDAATDQRGAGSARTVDGAAANATGGDGTDIGAFERQIGEIDPTPGGVGGVGGRRGAQWAVVVVDVVAVDLMVAAEVMVEVMVGDMVGDMVEDTVEDTVEDAVEDTEDKVTVDEEKTNEIKREVVF